MSSSSGRRALAPLLARFARRFGAAEWTMAAEETLASSYTTASLHGADTATTIRDHRRHRHPTPSTRCVPPTPPTPTPPTTPLLASPFCCSLVPDLSRPRSYSSPSAPADKERGGGESAAQSAKEQGAPPPAAAANPTSAAASTAATTPETPPLHRRLLPPLLVPYAELMRLDKPVGSWLLAWPGLWSVALCSPPSLEEFLRLSALFAAGSVALRGAGCTINDLLDRDIDARVARTRSRPLPSGAVSPLGATFFLGGQLLVGLSVLAQLNAGAQLLAGASLLLVGLYPLMKRITWWPQLFLGLTINWPALVGWAAASPAALAMDEEQEGSRRPIRLTSEALGSVWLDPAGWAEQAWASCGASLQAAAGGGGAAAAAAAAAAATTAAWLPPLALYGSGVAWTLVYDTIYAHQDIRDDEKVGVKSTARLFARRGVSKGALGFFGAAQQALLWVAGAAAGLGPAYYACAACAGAHVAWQVKTVDLGDGPDCARKFASNKWTGALVWAGIVADRALGMMGAGFG
jgi:4-hydroxybenzoate polyprenyltransferase